ncbi:MAG: glycosyltransferase family 39 protein [Anaerolineae bacterium]|nr:glycosyltransferase family 39 protein [Anaerolineae bacterium]
MNCGSLRSGTLLFAILLLALGLRLYRLDGPSLWNDEGTSVAVAQRDLATIAHDAAHDIHPPLYYWLLHGWVRLLGTGEAAVRSLSALLGVALVALIYALVRRLRPEGGAWIGLLAAFLAAVNPFQVYYSQEARMYMLAAVLAAAAMLALVRFVQSRSAAALAALVVLEAAGLYTHYSFIFAIVAANLGYLLSLRTRRLDQGQALGWIAAQAGVVLLYLPWLPTALRQATSWPGPSPQAPFFQALADTWRWLALGPTIETGQAAAPLLAAAFLAVVGLFGWSGRRAWKPALLAVWLAVPAVSILALGLYREAYLKFLLVASPPVMLLLAAGASGYGERLTRYVLRFVQMIALLLVLVGAGAALRNYYVEPAYARDDYRGIAAYIEALGREGDAIVLNAPGQQEVFGYYYHGDLPVYPLPTSRPPDPAATEAALSGLVRPGGRVFAVLWATGESDPEQVVEGWLDRQAYQALDAWYGNVRLVVYAVPGQAPSAPDRSMDVLLRSARSGDEIRLVGYSLAQRQLSAGDIAPITLFWQTEQALSRRYKLFAHVLDARDQIVGQIDAEILPGQPGEQVAGNFGVPVHPATPPGEYRVETGLYDLETGERMLAPDGSSQVWLEPLTVERPLAPAPLLALGMERSEGASFGEIALLGYDQHRLGFAHQPEAALRPGDMLHVNLYWQAKGQPAGHWQVVLSLVSKDGRQVVELSGELVNGYATSEWQAGDVWRGQFNLPLPADLKPGRYRVRVQPIRRDGQSVEPFSAQFVNVGE